MQLQKLWHNLSEPISWSPVQYLAVVPVLAAVIVSLLEMFFASAPSTPLVLVPWTVLCLGCLLVAGVTMVRRGTASEVDVVLRGPAVPGLFIVASIVDVVAVLRRRDQRLSDDDVRAIRTMIRSVLREELSRAIGIRPVVPESSDFTDISTGTRDFGTAETEVMSCR